MIVLDPSNVNESLITQNEQSKKNRKKNTNEMYEIIHEFGRK